MRKNISRLRIPFPCEKKLKTRFPVRQDGIQLTAGGSCSRLIFRLFEVKHRRRGTAKSYLNTSTDFKPSETFTSPNSDFCCSPGSRNPPRAKHQRQALSRKISFHDKKAPEVNWLSRNTNRSYFRTHSLAIQQLFRRQSTA